MASSQVYVAIRDLVYFTSATRKQIVKQLAEAYRCLSCLLIDSWLGSLGLSLAYTFHAGHKEISGLLCTSMFGGDKGDKRKIIGNLENVPE